MNVGYLDTNFLVKDLKASIHFYEVLGFKVTGGTIEEGFCYLSNGHATLGLFSKYIKKNQLNFRGGDVFAIEKKLEDSGYQMKEKAVVEEDGSEGAYIEDPDGNLIYFNTCEADKKKIGL